MDVYNDCNKEGIYTLISSLQGNRVPGIRKGIHGLGSWVIFGNLKKKQKSLSEVVGHFKIDQQGEQCQI